MVLAREGGSYRVLVDGIERIAVLRGRAKRDEMARAVAGDRVTFDRATLDAEVMAIDAVVERTSLLARRTPEGRGTRPVAANVDQVIVVTAAADPAPIPQLIDRLLVVAEANEIPALVVVNKVDLAAATPVRAHLAAAGYELLEVSAATGAGLDALRTRVGGRESVFAGPSGAGKSSLLNALEPGLGLRVGAISEKVRRGTHTTVTATMVPLAVGGFVVDTPGFSEVGVWAVARRDLAGCFPEFRAPADECRFGDCLHRSEPGCGVRAAVAAGTIPAERHASYLAILAELEAHPEDWE
ncbi:MAG TPA: ribosome small subunit-dependent GTPase A [Gemmatimonadales bacterium]|nr:ribosome small subunit-dependent GTPase A [Gemmatimonadales bacterium]